jgi:hypothetical protein
MKALLAGAALAALYMSTTLVGCDPARGLLMSGPPSGLASAPIRPQAVHTMQWQSERTVVSSGSQ